MVALLIVGLAYHFLHKSCAILW